MAKEGFSPIEENLGQNCKWWNLDRNYSCNFPKAEVEGRRSCEGIIDDVCLYLLRKRLPTSLSAAEIMRIKTTPPSKESNALLPPGDIV